MDLLNGRPQAPPDEQRRRIAICEGCELLDACRSCRACGCAMDVKTGWADMRCGDVPPRWVECEAAAPGKPFDAGRAAG